MIHKYREGDMLGVGLNVGWVCGPVIVWYWINVKNNTSSRLRLRFNYLNRKFWIDKHFVGDYEKDFIANYTMVRGMTLVANEYLEDIGVNELAKELGISPAPSQVVGQKPTPTIKNHGSVIDMSKALRVKSIVEQLKALMKK